MLPEDYPPLSERYPARYRDTRGEVVTTISNDGDRLCMTLRGVEFVSFWFSDWEPQASSEAQAFTAFDLESLMVLREGKYLQLTELRSFVLECEIPLPLVFKGKSVQGTLQVHLTHGEPFALSQEDQLHLTLLVADKTFTSDYGDFETGLLDLFKQLPEDMHLDTCVFCAFSTSHPDGYPTFGGLCCFKRVKQEFLARRSKTDLRHLLAKKQFVNVQEIYRCPEFCRPDSLPRRPQEH